MRWYGKLLGFVAGWLLVRHPAGAALGLVLGHALDADWFRTTRDDPYEVLGLTPDASDGELERAYRRLIAQYHPDRLGGVAPDLREQAEEKARQINAAYERVQKQRRK
ncbi:MAG TPA: DnaJ domain-containing protein [Arenimonas sp.]|uniref:J domain-containing protein n=1 Tax=Arenimonas sp. TaxID=1872635 RepID=UPI002D7EE5DD|nr:DnaJ domain-containing protein [Arenimonas sp.]HEU0152285.1 DnaJ domain-containing protein [Arenimonas sp.]